jgi:hypothetical protein
VLLEEFCSVDAVQLAPVVSATVSMIAGAGSVYGWWRAKGERRKAADSAATAAGALKQIAELHTQHDQRQQSREAAEQRDPWSIQPINGAQADLVNNTGTPKYGINVKIYAGGNEPHNLFADDNIDFVGPRRSARITYINLNAEIKAIITWHLLENQTDEQPPQIITW